MSRLSCGQGVNASTTQREVELKEPSVDTQSNGEFSPAAPPIRHSQGEQQMTRSIFLALTGLLVSVSPLAAQEILEGTWKLVSSQRTNQATGATADTFGPNPQGFIMYGRDGRMMVLETQNGRPRVDSTDKATGQQRERLLSSMIAYAGTYKFDGKTIEHHIDISWNEVWNGTTQVRDVKREGDQLIYTTRPAQSPVDGTMGFATLIWEKIK